MRKAIEIGTNLAILLVCCLLGWTLLVPRFINFGGKKAATEADLLGVKMPLFPGYSWNNHHKTLVLAIREGCSFCEASLPFYKRLGDLERQGSIRTHVVAVMPDAKAPGENTLRSSGVDVEGIFGQSLESFKVSGTPTLLLVDQDGRVSEDWIGKLDTTREGQVISAIQQ